MLLLSILEGGSGHDVQFHLRSGAQVVDQHGHLTAFQQIICSILLDNVNALHSPAGDSVAEGGAAGGKAHGKHARGKGKKESETLNQS